MIAFRLINVAVVQENLRGSVGRVTAEVANTMKKEMGQLATYVQESKLSGQVLHQRTGNLVRSILPNVEQDADSILGTVGLADASTVPYAAFWELGFQGTETIRQHVRRNRAGGVSTVREHARKVDVGPRSFLQSAYQDRVEAIAAAIAQSVDASLQAAS
jgi:hypothetical protein